MIVQRVDGHLIISDDGNHVKVDFCREERERQRKTEDDRVRLATHRGREIKIQ